MYLDHILFFTPPLSFLLVCMFVFILTPTAKAIDEHRPINKVFQPGIEPGTLWFDWFQDNYEMHNATMRSMERIKVDTKGKRSPDGLNYPYQNTLMVNIICQYFIRNRKVQLNSINKIQNRLKQSKNEKSIPLPQFFFSLIQI